MKANLTIPSVGLTCVVAIGLAWGIPSGADFDLNDAVGVWHLDEGEGDIAHDSSKSGDDGKLFRDPVWVDGRFGKALEFDGESFVWMKEATGVPTGKSPRTLMCHFKWAEINQWVNVVREFTDAEFVFSTGPSAWNARVSLGMLQEGGAGLGVDCFEDRWFAPWEGDLEWHHLAAVLPDGGQKTNDFLIYFDGVLQEDMELDDDAVSDVDSVGGQVTIGCQSGGITAFFKGIVDDCAIFPFAMSQENIAEVARRGLVRGQTMAVSPRNRLATSWGALKERE